MVSMHFTKLLKIWRKKVCINTLVARTPLTVLDRSLLILSKQRLPLEFIYISIFICLLLLLFFFFLIELNMYQMIDPGHLQSFSLYVM